MSIIDVKIFNILVHYGDHAEKNFIELLDEVLLEQLLASVTAQFKKEYMYPADVSVTTLSGKKYLTGYFYKSSTLKWKTTPNENGRHKTDPGNKKVLPYAKFFIDLEEHRLFWITERGLSSSPSAYNLKSYIKKICLPILKQDAEGEAAAAWKNIPRGSKNETWQRYLTRFLSERNLTQKTFKIDLNPEVSNEKIKKILDHKYHSIRRAIFYPKLNNATKNHLKQLFTGVGQLASETKGQGQVKIESVEKDMGLKKEPIFNLLEVNDKDQLLSFEFTIKDTRQSDSRPFKISNTNVEGSDRIQKVETLHQEIEAPNLLKTILEKVGALPKRTRTKKQRDDLKKRIKELLK